MKITIGGYYGFGNLGDESTLALIIRDVKEEFPHAQITVISAKSYEGVKNADRNSLHEIKAALQESEILILGGGNLIQDGTSLRSLFYYCELIKLAHKLNNEVYVMGGGIGPLTHRDYAAQALKLCKRISVRDEASQKILCEMGIPASLSCDRIFSLTSTDHSGRGRYFTVNVRKCLTERNINCEDLADALYPFVSEGLTPVYVSMQDKFDLPVSENMISLTGGRITTPATMDELIRLHRGAKFAVGMRLHFLLAAAVTACPTVSLSYDCKSQCLPFSAVDAFSFRPFELTELLRRASAVPLPENARELCRQDVLEIGKILERNAKNGSPCLK